MQHKKKATAKHSRARAQADARRQPSQPEAPPRDLFGYKPKHIGEHSTARLDPETGEIVPGDWIVPARGPSRFATELLALRYAYEFLGMYPQVFQMIIVRESSKSRPGQSAYQTYIRSLGVLEGLVRFARV